MAQTPGETNATNAVAVVELDQPRIQIQQFAVALPTSTLQGLEEPTPKGAAVNSLIGDNGVVGSIIYLQNSVTVWVGWGKIDMSSTSSETQSITSHSSSIGTGK
jgi:hypothetical protein